MIVSLKGKTALVEWKTPEKNLRRGYLPLDDLDLENFLASPEVLGSAAPYGEPWEEIIKIQTTPQVIGDMLRNARIFTLTDFEKNPQAAVNVFQACLKMEIGQLRRFIREFYQNQPKTKESKK